MTTLQSTYRLQLRREFGFREAAEVVPYLSRLGITHLYLSPCTQSVEGSTHGYDVVDPTRVSDHLGGPEAFAQLVAAAKEHGLGIVVDIVPNHMATAGRDNKWWWDVLKHGRRSRFANYFDIDWASNARDSVLLPVLGDHYGRVLERNELTLERTGDELVIRYFDKEFPIDPETISASIDVDEFNNDVDSLEQLIDAQNYRLAYWRVAREALDYRRFFDINTLVAVRSDDPEVFCSTHALVVEWLRDGVIDGVRVDHIDGLRDPLAYLRRLREHAGDKWIVVEKILSEGERPHASWPVQGTTGYEASRLIDGLFVDESAEAQMTEFYSTFVGGNSWREVVIASKRMTLREVLGSDVVRLVGILVKVCESRRRFRDFIRSDLRAALEAVLVAMPVYRTYVVPETSQITASDQSVIDHAVTDGAELDPELDPELFDLIARILKLELTGVAEAELVLRFQQLSGAVCAKSVEDTAFYRYLRFVASNEVGNDPSHWSTRPDDFHERAAEDQRLWPEAMKAGSTHDSKRASDVRSRLAVLTCIPGEWIGAVERWSKLNEVHQPPDRASEYLLYQTMVGAYPLDEQRAVEYMLKAAREAKVATSWTARNEE